MEKRKISSRSMMLGIAFVILFGMMSVLFVACGSKETKVSNYAELVEAISGKCEVITLTKDVVVEDTLVITRDIILNLNGKQLSNTADIWDTQTNSWSLISVRKGGDLTIKGDGKLLAKENDCYAVDVMDGGKLVIESGIFIGNVSAVYVFEGTAEIKGGEYSIQQLDNNHHDERFTLNLYDKNGTASIVVTGGTFHDFDPANCLAEGPNTNFVASGYTTQLKADTTDVYEVIIASQE